MTSRSRLCTSFTALLVAVLAVAALPAAAQTTGDIEGSVLDSGGAPLPGASVEIKSPALQGTRTAVSDSSGRFRFPALPPGSYTVTAALAGFTKVEKPSIRVVLGGTANVPVTLSISAKEELVITGEAPVIDTTKTTIGTSASLDSIQRLPLGRNFASIASTVAGAGTDQRNGLTVYGATSLENAYIIDGVNTTGVKIGDQGKQLNNEFVQEVEVKTGGYEAEFGRVLGGTINVLTKSGGNEFHGDVFGYYDSSSLAADDKRAGERRAAARDEYFTPKRFDVGVGLGGYFVKDTLWFFGAYDRVATDQDYNRTLTQGAGGGGPRLIGGRDETRSNLYAGKLTLRAGTAHTFSVSAFGDPAEFDGRFQVFRGARPTNIGPDSQIRGSGKSGGTDVSAKYDGILSSTLLVQGQYSFHSEKAQESSPFANAFFLERNQPGFRNESLPGSGPDNLFDQKYRRHAYRASATLFVDKHEIKGGLDWEHLTSDFSERYPGGGRVRLRLNAAGGLRNVQHRYYAVTPIQNNCIAVNDPTQPFSIQNCSGYRIAASVDNPPTTDNVAFFAQDSFKVLPTLTVNAGLRYETQKLKDFSGATLIDIKDEWSPRVGFVWDFMGNGRSKLYGNYGLFYSTIPQDIQTRALGNEYTVFVRNQTQNAVDPVDAGIFGYGVVQGGELTQDGLKGMYQKELVGGIEYEFAPNWAFGVKGIYRALGRVVEDRCDLAVNPDVAAFYPAGSTTTCALVNVGEGNGLGTLKDPADPTCYPNGYGAGVAGAPCDSTLARRSFRGIEMTLNHRFSKNFYMLGSYLYSKLEGNYSGAFSQTRENGQTDPNINADFDYPGLLTNAFGLLPNDRKHQAKLSGYYVFPFGLTAGLTATYASGRPLSVFGCALDAVACGAGYDREGFLVRRGSAGRMPSTYEADLHLEYAARIGAITITPVVDVFNALNRQTAISRDELFNLQSTLAGNDPRSGIGQPGCTAQNASLQNTACASNPSYGKNVDFQNPRVIRLGARISF